VIALLALACSSTPSDTTTTPTPTPQPTDKELPGVEVVTFETSDGVTLEGDYYGVNLPSAPGFVLVHMIPPGNDRTNWPVRFVDALRAEGWAVLAIDRRGAGGSGGYAMDAYEGDNGKLDVAAAADLLADRGHGDLVVVGASNGTTSMIDYAAWAGANDHPVPVALGFMTGGAYTENQTTMAGLPDIPSVFTYSTAERAWSEAQRPLDPGTWSFLEYEGGDHGTRMFEAKPRVTRNLVDFFAPLL